MKANFTIFKSRFAYRIFFLFIICAVVPLSLLALISFTQISDHLLNSTHERLHRQSLNMAGLIVWRCVLTESEIDLIASHYTQKTTPDLRMNSSTLKDYFLSAAYILPQKTPHVIFGNRKSWPALTIQQRKALTSGTAIIFTERASADKVSLYLAKEYKDPGGNRITYLAEIRPQFLLGMYSDEEDFFGTLGVTILDKTGIIFTTLPPERSQGLIKEVNPGKWNPSPMLEHITGKDSVYSISPIFLQGRFTSPFWALVLSEPTAVVFKPVKSFKIIFALVILLTFVIVLLISSIQIRKYLMPLESLKEGTVKISQGDLSTQVLIRSGDEFEDLAESFNTMVTRIDQQFKTLNTMADIDRAVLSESDFTKIIDTFIRRINTVCPCDAAGVCFRYHKQDARWMTHYQIFPSFFEKDIVESHILKKEDLSALYHAEIRSFDTASDYIPRFFRSLEEQKQRKFLALPITMNTQLMAIVFMGWKSDPDFDNAFQDRARQVADRVAVAFRNAYLINELNILNWGTLTALARVVDEKSPWTAGHSERVAAMAVKIGKAMGLSAQELDILNKAGMLHDIGKVNTPRAILDKNSRLSPEEWAVIYEHPGRGAHILEPITPYAGMVPFVLQHHERFDGNGYPERLEGTEISLGARILSVADAFDAMTSDRPYRPAMEIPQAIQEIRNNTGSQFDPDVVKAFLKLMDMKEPGKESI